MWPVFKGSFSVFPVGGHHSAQSHCHGPQTKHHVWVCCHGYQRPQVQYLEYDSARHDIWSRYRDINHVFVMKWKTSHSAGALRAGLWGTNTQISADPDGLMKSRNSSLIHLGPRGQQQSWPLDCPSLERSNLYQWGAAPAARQKRLFRRFEAVAPSPANRGAAAPTTHLWDLQENNGSWIQSSSC